MYKSMYSVSPAFPQISPSSSKTHGSYPDGSMSCPHHNGNSLKGTFKWPPVTPVLHQNGWFIRETTH